MKIYLNTSCPCGSGKKYKDCCAKKSIPSTPSYVNKNGFHFDSTEKNADFIVNRKGAVIFNDESKQPVLKLTNGTTTKTVLSVGLNKSGKPMATIKEPDGPICYILPNWYTEWCTSCVSMAVNGTNVFPAEVKFTKQNGKYAANIL